MTKTHIAESVLIAKDKAQYDTTVKRILSDKNILAWIMKGTMKEFYDVPISEIVDCIEGVPEVSNIPIEPGRTNTVITGDNTEDKIPNEGEVTFDVRFRAVAIMKDLMKIIVNVEAQRKYYPGYDLVTRGVFYGARLISSQKDKEFVASYYDDIKKVYSIWVCMKAPKYLQNTITEYSIQQQKIYGNFCGDARYDLMSVIMICLGDTEKCCDNSSDQAKVIRLLSVLASESMEPNEKLEILQEEYHIKVTRDFEKEVNSMCNWSDEIEERATERGLAKGLAKGLEQGLEQGLSQGLEQGLAQGKILGAIDVYHELGMSAEEVIMKIMEKFAVTQEEAEGYVQQKLAKNE